MSTVQIPAEQRLRLSLIPWETYVAYSDGLGPRHIRVTYDRGEMEVLTVSPEHEHGKKRLARLVEALTEELGIDIASYGSMTFRREDLERALEPDECYWIQNEPVVRGRKDLDIESDPPPNLVLEVEVSRSTLDRMSIYAVLGVPEVWRWNGRQLTIALLKPNGSYRASKRSRAFPFLPIAEFAGFVTRPGVSETSLVRSFRKWVREQAAAGWHRSSK